MTKNYDKEFGPEGVFAWPACTDRPARTNVAKRFLEAAPYAKSGPDCLNDEFFYDDYDERLENPRVNSLDSYIFLNCPDDYPYEMAVELAEAAAKEREELFKEARSWPLPYLVASATYKILSVERGGVPPLWDCFLWPFLCFDQPLSDMLRSKKWGEVHKNNIRKGLKSQLEIEIKGLGHGLVWGRDEEKPWFTATGFTSHIYPNDVLRCLELVGIDPPLAGSAVDQVFRLQSLIPLYDVLSDKPFSMPATGVKGSTVVKGRHRSEEGEKGSPKKPFVDLRVHVRNSIYGALLLAGVAIAYPYLRSSRSKWTSKPSNACFAAASRIGNVRLNEIPDHDNASIEGLTQHPPLATAVTASASQQPRSRPRLTALKKMTANLPTLKVSRTKTPFPFFIKTYAN